MSIDKTEAELSQKLKKWTQMDEQKQMNLEHFGFSLIKRNEKNLFSDLSSGHFVFEKRTRKAKY